MSSSFLVLCFDTSNYDHALEELNEAFDNHSTAASMVRTPELIVVKPDLYPILEKQLEEFIKARYATKKLKTNPTAPNLKDRSYPALTFRARPIVAIDGINIIADRVGANE